MGTFEIGIIITAVILVAIVIALARSERREEQGREYVDDSAPDMHHERLDTDGGGDGD